MNKKNYHIPVDSLPKFDRNFFEGTEPFTRIGTGEIGGKAQGLALLRELLQERFNHSAYSSIHVAVPIMTVIATDWFDEFIKMNNLDEIANSDARDDQIAHAFQKGSLPPTLVGDLRALITKVHSPLAIRSSSLLEDALYQPFAGVYCTKMIPNNQFDADTRFQKLLEAVKFVYASTFFRGAKDYIRATGQKQSSEKMAVIIQEVVGLRQGDRFYPNVSGVGRSYNYYPTGHARPEEGVVNLALGLGKTIVDGGISYTYSPSYPNARPLSRTIDELLDQSQTEFWAVNMGKPPEHDPIHETEYLIKGTVSDAEKDEILAQVASTYRPQEDRLVPGIGYPGPRLLDFAPILNYEIIPLNKLVKELLGLCQERLEAAVEIEFAVTIDPKSPSKGRFGFLQVRPMVVSDAVVDVAQDELHDKNMLLASERVMGNGIIDNLTDIVYVKPTAFDPAYTRIIAGELEKVNRQLLDNNQPYLLIGLGRWGTSESWLGIPVEWSQISGAKVIVEATLPKMDVELSQGSHFFHNISSFQVMYFSIAHSGKYKIDWDWLDKQTVVTETDYVKHVKVASPITVKVDGRSSRGVVIHG